MRKHVAWMVLVLCLALAAPAAVLAGSADDLRLLAANARAQAGDQLNTCAADRGLATQGEPSFLTTEDSSAVLLPLAGVDALTRADLANWTDIGIFTVAGPPDAEAPSGTFVVRVQAPPGSTVGHYEIVDADGLVVQSGELMISDDPDDPNSVPTTTEPTSQPIGSLTDTLRSNGSSMLPGDQLYFGSPWCYYPYYWHWRIYPYYWHGCHWWWYRWPWGHLKFRYCWWPGYYHCTRWFCHWW